MPRQPQFGRLPAALVKISDVEVNLREAVAYLDNAEALEALASVRHAKNRLHLAEVDLVRRARRDGETWDLIGEALSTSPQAAHARFSRLT